MNAEKAVKVDVRNLSFYYNETEETLKNISIQFFKNTVTALIGPSGCGKSTFLRTINRMNEYIDKTRIEGTIYLDNKDIYSTNKELISLRKHVGMVFQKPNPFPKSIFKNISYGPKIHGERDRHRLAEIVERSLKRVGLWEEVKHKLHKSAFKLSGGQQQRLCIARALAVNPQVILMDEPASALDPVATTRIEELILELKRNYTIIIVTHNLQQAARISDYTAFFYLGELIENGKTEGIFTNPKDKRTEEYITGRFG